MQIAETYYEDVIWCPNCGTLVDADGIHVPATRSPAPPPSQTETA